MTLASPHGSAHARPSYPRPLGRTLPPAREHARTGAMMREKLAHAQKILDSADHEQRDRADSRADAAARGRSPPSPDAAMGGSVRRHRELGHLHGPTSSRRWSSTPATRRNDLSTAAASSLGRSRRPLPVRLMEPRSVSARQGGPAAPKPRPYRLAAPRASPKASNRSCSIFLRTPPLTSNT